MKRLSDNIEKILKDKYGIEWIPLINSNGAYFDAENTRAKEPTLIGIMVKELEATIDFRSGLGWFIYEDSWNEDSISVKYHCEGVDSLYEALAIAWEGIDNGR